MTLPHHLQWIISNYYYTASLILFNYWLKPLVNQELFSKCLCNMTVVLLFSKKGVLQWINSNLSFMHHCMPAFLYLDMFCGKYIYSLGGLGFLFFYVYKNVYFYKSRSYCSNTLNVLVCCFFTLCVYVTAVTLLDM